MTSIKVKNIGRTIVYLKGGPIEPGREGMATESEFSMLYQYLEKVVEPVRKRRSDRNEILPHPKEFIDG